ncbi:uroporphyrinogen decarboxylase [Moheibacter stercoris]|uniref:Uroporphyrinogen decarboxylase n=1 Tax=Moheibacter stercoris TaxID=1628251 RepID=A0ABV2LXS6_9FLAO
MQELKNDLLLRALKGEELQRPPVWMMRQAGRYLPEFIALRDQYDFFTRCQTPELATEITVQPIRRFPLDAAILFSDILVVPQAMGMNFEMKHGIGPWLENPIRTVEQVQNVIVPDVEETLGYVFEAIKLTKKELDNKIPLIGFAGSPWTILCYCIEGRGSKSFDIAKGFCFQHPEAAHELLQKITDTTIAYLLKKAEMGCNVIQIFDSWGGMLSPKDYDEFSWKYIEQIVNAVSEVRPVTVFAKGCWFALEKMSQSKASALGVDWTVTPEVARQLTNNSITLQGNFDPSRLLSKPEKIQEMVKEMIDGFGTTRYIANLGHGILPNVPVENAQAFIQAVVNYRKD